MVDGCQGEAGPPALDVVFVHGIRGGPFVTWRKGGEGGTGATRGNMQREACWISDWLAEEAPGARLLSLEYVAPVSFWEVGVEGWGREGVGSWYGPLRRGCIFIDTQTARKPTPGADFAK